MSRPQLEVRPLGPGDAEIVRRLHHRAFRTEHRFSDTVLERLFSHERATNLVALARGRIVGYCCAMHGTGDRARVVTIHVDAACQGAGVGRALLAELLVRLAARRVRDVELGVHVRNQRARALYERAGFVVVEEDPQAYPKLDPPDGLVLRKEIGAPLRASGRTACQQPA